MFYSGVRGVSKALALGAKFEAVGVGSFHHGGASCHEEPAGRL